MKIAICYSGSYNYFDLCYYSQKKKIFNILKKENIDYDIFASIGESISFRSLKFNDELFKKFHKSISEYKNILPSDEEIDYFFKNSKSIGDNLTRYFSDDQIFNIFNNKFGKKLINYDNSKLITTGFEWVHNALLYNQTSSPRRNLILKKKIRDYEKKNDIKYDAILVIRPDIYISSEFNESLKDMITKTIKEDKIYIGYCQKMGIKGPRMDYFFLSKKLSSEIYTDKFVESKTKDKPYKYYNPHNTWFNYYTEYVIKKEIDHIPVMNVDKFYGVLFNISNKKNKLIEFKKELHNFQLV
jgi:hypothetical protein